MANISIYDPLTHRLGRFFNQFALTNPNFFEGMEPVQPLALKMDVSEDDRQYLVHADLPGVKKEDIRVTVSGNQITINAEVKNRKEEKKGKNVVHCERYEGKVFRSFTLDCAVDDSRTEARFCDGVLELTLPKQAESGQRQIKVQ